MAPPVRRVLLVEGENDLHSIAHLVRHHVPTWPRDQSPPPVLIKPYGGIDAILTPTGLRATLKTTDWDILGVVVDADHDPARRWAGLRSICAEMFHSVPDRLPSAGLIDDTSDGKKFGLWLMPDCDGPGALETFLHALVPESGRALWAFAGEAFEQARALNSPCRDVHHDKARIHTYLAWQDPPGEPFGRAIARGILDPKLATDTPFINWFKTLYGL
jgi:hypothetical protein